jgi:hypothetical protein
MHKLTIPKPCFENWEQMLPNQLGRHCNTCATTVIDFSVMTDEEVQNYFVTHNNQPVCGRFKTAQLNRIRIDLPQNIFSLQLPFWKKFLVAFLICFGANFLAIDTAIANTPFSQGKPVFQKEILKAKKSKGSKNRHKRKQGKLSVLTIPIDWHDWQSIGIVSKTVANKKQIPEIGWNPEYCESDIMGSIIQNSENKKHSPLVDTITKNGEKPQPAEPPAPTPTKNEMILTSSFAIRKYLHKAKDV